MSGNVCKGCKHREMGSSEDPCVKCIRIGFFFEFEDEYSLRKSNLREADKTLLDLMDKVI